MKLKPHIVWPAFIIAILLGSVLAQAILVTAANSDGGAQPIPNYYENAVHESKRSMGTDK